MCAEGKEGPRPEGNGGDETGAHTPAYRGPGQLVPLATICEDGRAPRPRAEIRVAVIRRFLVLEQTQHERGAGATRAAEGRPWRAPLPLPRVGGRPVGAFPGPACSGSDKTAGVWGAQTRSPCKPRDCLRARDHSRAGWITPNNSEVDRPDNLNAVIWLAFASGLSLASELGRTSIRVGKCPGMSPERECSPHMLMGSRRQPPRRSRPGRGKRLCAFPRDGRAGR